MYWSLRACVTRVSGFIYALLDGLEQSETHFLGRAFRDPEDRAVERPRCTDKVGICYSIEELNIHLR